MTGIQKLIARAKVVLGAAPAYILGISAAVTAAAHELATVLPSGAATEVAAWAVRVVAVLAGAVAIIRGVTPVLEKGLLTAPVAKALPATTPPSLVVVPTPELVDEATRPEA